MASTASASARPRPSDTLADENGIPVLKKARTSADVTFDAEQEELTVNSRLTHRKEQSNSLSHPPVSLYAIKPRAQTILKPTAGSPPKCLPPCKFGANCYHKNLLHFAQYSHPTANDTDNGRSLPDVKEDNENSDSSEADTDIESDNSDEEKDKNNECDMEVNECMTSKLTGSICKNDTVLMRGPSILRCYSTLTEEQRKDLIRRAFEMKQYLVHELGETNKILREKNKKLEMMRGQIEKGRLTVEGEAEALMEDKLIYFALHAERTYRQGSAAQIHFRLAESQFYRLLPGRSTFKVTKVEYVVQPKLVKRFKKARNKLKKNRSEEASFPVLAFHGTKENNIHSICDEGFRVPGEPGFHHSTDPGWYGRGVYFSEFPSYSMAYIRDGIKLLLCQVLPGKVFKCTRISHGEPLRHGYDSHMSPDGKELVIFNSHHILPSYVVYYKPMQGDFQYEKDE